MRLLIITILAFFYLFFSNAAFALTNESSVSGSTSKNIDSNETRNQPMASRDVDEFKIQKQETNQRINRLEDSIDQRINRIEDRGFAFLAWACGFIAFILTLVGSIVFHTLRRDLKEHIREIVSTKLIKDEIFKEIENRIKTEFEHLTVLHRQIMEGLATFNAQDFESSYHTFKSIYEASITRGENDPFVTSHYAYLADKIGDDGTARRLYQALLIDTSNNKNDYYAKSAVNYANFIMREISPKDDNSKRALQVLVTALTKSDNANGRAILQLSIASYHLLHHQTRKGLEELQLLKPMEEFKRNPKMKLEAFFYHYVYDDSKDRGTYKQLLENMISLGDRSPYWTFEPHLEYVSKNMPERRSDVERIARAIKLGSNQKILLPAETDATD
jgi:hypothetical protein